MTKNKKVQSGSGSQQQRKGQVGGEEGLWEETRNQRLFIYRHKLETKLKKRGLKLKIFCRECFILEQLDP
jgi:hypothetical protein